MLFDQAISKTEKDKLQFDEGVVLVELLGDRQFFKIGLDHSISF